MKVTLSLSGNKGAYKIVQLSINGEFSGMITVLPEELEAFENIFHTALVWEGLEGYEGIDKNWTTKESTE